MTTRFEEEYGADPKLAQRFLNDPYKAPEQKMMAQEYLDSLND